MRTLLFIGGGSFLGGIARYLVKVGCGKLFPAATLPLGTMVANVAGCFLIGLFYGIASRHTTMSQDMPMFLTVGFCGGFTTTFLTFMNENMSMIQGGELFNSLLYAVLSLVLGLAFLYLGTLASRI